MDCEKHATIIHIPFLADLYQGSAREQNFPRWFK